VGGAHVAFDMVGRATDPDATLAALRSLRRGGRLVLMGSMNVPLCISYGKVMVNNWEIIGNFVYANSAYRRLLDLVRTGTLPLDAATVTAFFASRLARSDGSCGSQSRTPMHLGGGGIGAYLRHGCAAKMAYPRNSCHGAGFGRFVDALIITVPKSPKENHA
jgi:hypothetical protein